MKSSYSDPDVVDEEEILEREVTNDVEAGYKPETYERDLYLEAVAYMEPTIMPIVYDARPMMIPVTVAYDAEPVTLPVTCESQPVVVPNSCDSQPAKTTPYSSEPQATTTTTTVPMYDSQSTITQISSESELATASMFESEPVVETAPCEPTSEMYYTASSEVSLLSDMDLHERAQSEDSDRDRDDRNSVMAGHVAAMRERFESMTRTNTPCPDFIRSASPSFEVFRNASTSPDVDKS